MKKKNFKRAESLLYLMHDIFTKAIELQNLKIEEKDLDFKKKTWMESRLGNKVGSRLADSEYRKKEFPSGGEVYSAGCPEPEKEFVIKKRCENHGKDSLLMALEDGIKNGTIKPINIEELNLDFDFFKNYCQSPKEIHEEALENVLKTEKKTVLTGCHFRIKPEEAFRYFKSKEKELFHFVNRSTMEIEIINSFSNLERLVEHKAEIYFRWVQR